MVSMSVTCWSERPRACLARWRCPRNIKPPRPLPGPPRAEFVAGAAGSRAVHPRGEREGRRDEDERRDHSGDGEVLLVHGGSPFVASGTTRGAAVLKSYILWSAAAMPP